MIHFDLDHPSLRLGLVRADGVESAPSDAGLVEKIHLAEARVREDPASYSEAVRQAVRDLLRRGGYKPTGRGKPASEFLLGAAREQGLPTISNLVDIGNLVSLCHALPISVFDADLLGDDVTVRYGGAGESYVFNSSGQSMALAGIPVICRAGGQEPVGNAVKDSMLCKVRSETRRVLAIIYGSSAVLNGVLETACQELAQLLASHAGARETAWHVLPG